MRADSHGASSYTKLDASARLGPFLSGTRITPDLMLARSSALSCDSTFTKPGQDAGNEPTRKEALLLLLLLLDTSGPRKQTQTVSLPPATPVGNENRRRENSAIMEAAPSSQVDPKTNTPNSVLPNKTTLNHNRRKINKCFRTVRLC